MLEQVMIIEEVRRSPIDVFTPTLVTESAASPLTKTKNTGKTGPPRSIWTLKLSVPAHKKVPPLSFDPAGWLAGWLAGWAGRAGRSKWTDALGGSVSVCWSDSAGLHYLHVSVVTPGMGGAAADGLASLLAPLRL
ncbi:hypothetical protein E2C01_017103 [Portunus trituberculatus]|uniref:Uncharacterized protein n=1 Tax=Portunus trituberculatus TaxID=210409 RepID=A0A5B7DSQ0_PORTR|nr:hypothetical protein [Portunus trituberculatus]